MMTHLRQLTNSKRLRNLKAMVFAAITCCYAEALAADGDLDATFGTGGTRVPAGVALTTFGADSCASNDNANAIGIQSTGKIVVGGQAGGSGNANVNLALARFTSNGALDTSSFAAPNGKTSAKFATGQYDQLTNLAIDPGTDKIVVVGWSTNPDTSAPCGGGSNYNIGVARFTADGVLDSTFNAGGTPGKQVFNFYGCNDQATGVVVQPDHKAVVVGFATKGVSGSFNVTNYLVLMRLNSDGTFDSTFNGGNGANTTGKVQFDTTANGLGYASRIVLIPAGDPNAGKFIIVGSSTAGNFLVARFNSNGSLDTTFGTSGKTTTSFGSGHTWSANDVALQADGNIVVGGTEDGGSSFVIARYLSGGALDTAGFAAPNGFAATSFAPTFAQATNGTGKAVRVMSNGKIVLSGSVQGNDFTNDLGVIRYNANGTVDTTFGTSGKVFTHLGSNPNAVCGGGAPGSPVNNSVIPGRVFSNPTTRY